MAFNKLGFALLYILVIAAVTACKGGGASVGLPSISGAGDGIGYSPTGNGHDGGNGPGGPGTGTSGGIPTNRGIFESDIGTSSSGNGMGTTGALMMSDPNGSTAGTPYVIGGPGAENGGPEMMTPTAARDQDQSVFRSDFDFDSVYRTGIYEALLKPSPSSGSVTPEMVREFFGDDVSCSSISNSMRSLSQAVVDGSRCVVTEAMMAGAIEDVYQRKDDRSLKVISIAGLLSDGHRLASGRLPNRITVESKKTQAGVEVKVALCDGSKALRGEILRLEPGDIPGDSLYHSRILEAVDSSVGGLIQDSEIKGVVRHGQFLNDDQNSLKVNFRLLPDVARLESSPDAKDANQHKFPYGVVNAVFDTRTKSLKGASGYGQVLLSDASIPKTLNLSSLNLKLNPADESLSGIEGTTLPDWLVSKIDVGARILIDEKSTLTPEFCAVSEKVKDDDANLFDYFFQRIFGQSGESDPLVWNPGEGMQDRDSKSACLQMAEYASKGVIRDRSKELSADLDKFNCGGDQAADVTAAVAEPWVSVCMIKPPSTVFACAESKTEQYRESATMKLEEFMGVRDGGRNSGLAGNAMGSGM